MTKSAVSVAIAVTMVVVDLLTGCSANPAGPHPPVAAQAADYVGTGPWASHHYFLGPDQKLGCSINQPPDPGGPGFPATVACEGSLPNDLPRLPDSGTGLPLPANSITFEAGRAAQLDHDDDVAFADFPPTPKTLPYGNSLTVGTVTCTTDPQAGIVCHDTTGHGFMLSATTVYLTPTPTHPPTAAPVPAPADAADYPCWGIPDSALATAGLDPRTLFPMSDDTGKSCMFSGPHGLQLSLAYESGTTFGDYFAMKGDPHLVVTSIKVNGRAAIMKDASDTCAVIVQTSGDPLVIMSFLSRSTPDVPERPVEPSSQSLCQQAQLAATVVEPYLRR